MSNSSKLFQMNTDWRLSLPYIQKTQYLRIIFQMRFVRLFRSNSHQKISKSNCASILPLASPSFSLFLSTTSLRLMAIFSSYFFLLEVETRVLSIVRRLLWRLNKAQRKNKWNRNRFLVIFLFNCERDRTEIALTSE